MSYVAEYTFSGAISICLYITHKATAGGQNLCLLTSVLLCIYFMSSCMAGSYSPSHLPLPLSSFPSPILRWSSVRCVSSTSTMCIHSHHCHLTLTPSLLAIFTLNNTLPSWQQPSHLICHLTPPLHSAYFLTSTAHTYCLQLSCTLTFYSLIFQRACMYLCLLSCTNLFPSASETLYFTHMFR